MRLVFGIFVGLSILSSPCIAQPWQNQPTVTARQREAVSEERAAEVRAAIAEARKRQDRIDRENTNLWLRWTYAVCIGCGPMPRTFRPVHTHPLRVLSGVPAALDDERDRRKSRRA